MQTHQMESERGYVPPEDEDGGYRWQEVPGVCLTPEQPVHMHGAGHCYPQVLVIARHLLREHDLEVPCQHACQG